MNKVWKSRKRAFMNSVRERLRHDQHAGFLWVKNMSAPKPGKKFALAWHSKCGILSCIMTYCSDCTTQSPFPLFCGVQEDQNHIYLFCFKEDDLVDSLPELENADLSRWKCYLEWISTRKFAFQKLIIFCKANITDQPKCFNELLFPNLFCL